uniref:Uncharacterized protein n=1 Tax=Anopheles dirus TaxID=7168 RepID=A0A182NLH2_9DIPT
MGLSSTFADVLKEIETEREEKDHDSHDSREAFVDWDAKQDLQRQMIPPPRSVEFAFQKSIILSISTRHDTDAANGPGWVQDARTAHR